MGYTNYIAGVSKETCVWHGYEELNCYIIREFILDYTQKFKVLPVMLSSRSKVEEITLMFAEDRLGTINQKSFMWFKDVSFGHYWRNIRICKRRSYHVTVHWLKFPDQFKWIDGHCHKKIPSLKNLITHYLEGINVIL